MEIGIEIGPNKISGPVDRATEPICHKQGILPSAYILHTSSVIPGTTRVWPCVIGVQGVCIYGSFPTIQYSGLNVIESSSSNVIRHHKRIADIDSDMRQIKPKYMAKDSTSLPKKKPLTKSNKKSLEL